MSWYKQGFSNQPEMRGGRRGGGMNRLWVKPESRVKGMFLDSQPFCIYEHNPYLDGSWRNQTTCAGADSPDGCPLCEIGDEPEYVGFLTWVDFSPWTDNQGREHTFTKKLFPMKKKVWKILAAAAEKRGELTGWIVECYRSSKEEPSTGMSYDFEEKIAKPDWKAKFGSRIITYGDQTVDSYLQMIDYEQALAPKSTAELRRMANRLKFKGEPESSDEKSDDEVDEVPF